MARIRTIKPEFFTSDDVCSLSPLARLLYIATWCEADREGRLEWKPKTLRRKYLPEDACDADAICAELVEKGVIVLYGQGLAYVPSFKKHQLVNAHEAKSKHPDPSECTETHVHAPASEEMHVGNGKEGNGKEGRVDKSPTASTDSAASASPKRGTRLSDDWTLTPELRTFASDMGLDPDGTRDEFVDYWTAVPGSKGVKLDWEKTFKNRCRELAKRPRPGAPRQVASKPHVVQDENWSWRMEQWRKSEFWQPTWGPEPGKPGCFVPREFLQ